jgi:hypothetical protein
MTVAAFWSMLMPGTVVIVGVMVVTMPTMSMVVMLAPVIVGAFRVEGTHDVGRAAALAAGHVREHSIIFDIDRLWLELGGRMPLPQVPGEPQEAERVLGADFEQGLGRGPHLDEAAVLKLHNVAVVEHGRPIEIELHLEPAMAPDNSLGAGASLVVKPCGVRNRVFLHRRLPNEGCGAEHNIFLVSAPSYHEPVFAIEAQGSCDALGSPFCKSSIDMPSGERINAM